VIGDLFSKFAKLGSEFKDNFSKIAVISPVIGELFSEISRGGVMNTREFGVRLTRFRERLKLSITQFASLSGVDYMQISRYEKGQGLPSFETAIRLAKVLQISLDELATGSGPAEPPEPPVFRNTLLFNRMRELDQIPADRQEMALRVLDTVIAGHELQTLSDKLRRS
jgi:transcriptional regulator with XRE-family HTH domain